MRILHLSDTHLPAATGVDTDGVDARAALDGLLSDCRHVRGLDVVVVSGDVADDGSAAGYRDALASISAYAVGKDAASVFCVGNHDERSAFAEVLGTGHRDRTGAISGQHLLPDRNAAVSDVDGLRVITLDSLVPGHVHGVIGTDQLAALRTLLERPAPRGSVLVLHHPPIALDSEFWRSVNLQDSDALAEVLTGSDVRVVLCGHNHLQLSATMAGIPVWVTPGVASRIDLTAPADLERAVSGASATVVDLDAPHGPTFAQVHARDPQAGRQLYLVDAVSGKDVVEPPG